jgi:myo-inositol-1(or 4)-monophosphatase
MPICSGVRRYGAAALDLAYVAAGRYEGYWERNLNSWDLAAGVIIAREAGAMVESISTNGDPLIDGNIIAASEVQFNIIAKIIRN